MTREEKKELNAKRAMLKQLRDALQMTEADVTDITLTDDGNAVIVEHQNGDASIGRNTRCDDMMELVEVVTDLLWRRRGRENWLREIWFTNEEEDFMKDDSNDVIFCNDTVEEKERLLKFLKHRAFWIPAEEPPKRDGRYLVTMAGWIIGCREPSVEMAEYSDGEWSLEEEAILAWAQLPEPCGRSRE